MKQTFCQKFPDSREGRARLAARPGTRGLCSGGERRPRGRHRRPAGPSRAGPATPGGRGDTGRRAPGHRWKRGEQACGSPGQGAAGRAAVVLRGGPRQRWEPFACGRERERLRHEPGRRDESDFSGWFPGSPGREGAASPSSASCARRFSPGAPESAGRCPALHSPGAARGRYAGPGAAPPGRQSEGCRTKTVHSPHLGALFDPMCCLGRAVTEVVLVSEIGVFVRCSPHTFLTTVITKLIAGPKTDVKTSWKCLSVNNWEGGKTHYLIV